ncbi:MAG TPA: hypothetical protein ENM99_02610 [Desulfurella acetivorans]|uniref:8-oxoguanine DNA glycosylase N-terminal domain-containing protein n=1 Tax=Desulfurella acetivorans TaxID=33002 RepID=A0A7C6A7H5_DESAE|nr:hypothetical protein [Desulfurella acetivorans]
MNKIKVPFKFNLEYTLESGQIFRISKINDGYRVFSSVIFDVYFDGNYLYYNNADENYIKRFFSLDVDFDKITNEISKDTHINKALKAF